MDPRHALTPLALVAAACGNAGATLDARVDAVEARLAALEARSGHPHPAAIDDATGVAITTLSDAEVLGCVVQVTSEATRALLDHDARLGMFTDDITDLAWAPRSPCRWYTATRVVPFTPTGTKIEVEVLVTRGNRAGQRFVSDLRDEPRLASTLTAPEVDAALAGGIWTH